MIVVPKEKPVMNSLNSYYVKIDKLLEHYQGELSSGAIHFQSLKDEGIIFFDKDETLSGFYKSESEEIGGRDAVPILMKKVPENNFSIDIYEIDPLEIYFWASMPDAEIIYKDLSTDFTDFRGLIDQMQSNKLTGFIDAVLAKGEESGFIFFNEGEIVGGSYSIDKSESDDSGNDLELLIKRIDKSGGTCNVSKVPSVDKAQEVEETEILDQSSMAEVLEMLEFFLSIFERILKAQKIKADHYTLLKKKFLEKADKFDFLDPFVAEFEYNDNKIKFKGNASRESLVKGVVECVKELAEEAGALSLMKKEIGPWSKKYAAELENFDISF
jgi:hypothetical protein